MRLSQGNRKVVVVLVSFALLTTGLLTGKVTSEHFTTCLGFITATFLGANVGEHFFGRGK